ncbi:MAG: response regulator [Candidatus Riflebacteria bacterium]|nr:response regulator [Candidatus Riflebacteria bacterium]
MKSERQTILLVDDMPDSLKILSRILEQEHQILTAADGLKALEIALTQQPDIILLDVVLPDIDGYEVCSRLKAIPLTQAIPVIFITSLNQEDDEAQGFEVGGIDFISKPFNPLIVQYRIRNHLKLRRVENERIELVKELQAALAKVKLLSGLLPICSSCKKIRKAAFRAILGAVSAKILFPIEQKFFLQPMHFDDFTHFEKMVMGVTHTQHNLSSEQHEKVRSTFSRFMTPAGADFMMPIRVDLLRNSVS